MNVSASPTDIEAFFKTQGILAVELGRLTAGDGTHAAVLVPDSAKAVRGWSEKVGLAGGRFFSPGGGTGRSFGISGERSAITLALFPVDLAEQLLLRAGELEIQDRFLIAAYLRAYFGSLSRMIGCEGTQNMSELDQLAQAAGQDVSIFDDRAALDSLLAAAGWRPTHDMLERLGIADPWLRDHLLPRILSQQPFSRGVAVYFLRERSVSEGMVGVARDAIQASGFEILVEQALTPDLIEELRKATRGGNWRKGPFPLSGGPPAHLMFVLDVFPYAPDAQTRLRHPLLDNGRTLACKERVRKKILADIPVSRHFNPVHSTDTSNEAAVIADIVLGEEGRRALHQTVVDRLAQLAGRIGDGIEVTPGGDSFIYLRRGPTLRKLYRPHLAARADAALALHRTTAEPGSPWGQFLGGSAGAGYIDFAFPGVDYQPLENYQLPLDWPAAERLHHILKNTNAAGMRIAESTFFDSLWFAPQISEPVILGAELANVAQDDSDDMTSARWLAVTGMPRTVFFDGPSLRRRLWRQAIHPSQTWMKRAYRKARRGLSPLRRLIRR